MVPGNCKSESSGIRRQDSAPLKGPKHHPNQASRSGIPTEAALGKAGYGIHILFWEYQPSGKLLTFNHQDSALALNNYLILRLIHIPCRTRGTPQVLGTRAPGHGWARLRQAGSTPSANPGRIFGWSARSPRARSARRLRVPRGRRTRTGNSRRSPSWPSSGASPPASAGAQDRVAACRVDNSAWPQALHEKKPAVLGWRARSARVRIRSW